MKLTIKTPFEREALKASLLLAELPTDVQTMRRLDKIIDKLDADQTASSYEFERDEVELINRYFSGFQKWRRDDKTVKEAVYAISDMLDSLLNPKPESDKKKK